MVVDDRPPARLLRVLRRMGVGSASVEPAASFNASAASASLALKSFRTFLPVSDTPSQILETNIIGAEALALMLATDGLNGGARPDLSCDDGFMYESSSGIMYSSKWSGHSSIASFLPLPFLLPLLDSTSPSALLRLLPASPTPISLSRTCRPAMPGALLSSEACESRARVWRCFLVSTACMSASVLTSSADCIHLSVSEQAAVVKNTHDRQYHTLQWGRVRQNV
jgi:hypothetical protein